MPLTLLDGEPLSWVVRKIAVVGPGIVGLPMAALLAHARLRIGQDDPARVVVVQRRSPTSGWKVDAINRGESPIGGVEPDLQRVVADAVSAGLLAATHDCTDAHDADVILVCVQTDKKGIEPDYGPLYEALHGLAGALQARPEGNLPLLIIESTLAPSSMTTLIRDFFAGHGLEEGRDLLLANSPNRVMPGRLVERVSAADKLIGGLRPGTPALVARLYGGIVTRGTLHRTNSLTAEVVKTLENAYRDVRIAFAAEVARECDARDVDFYATRELANAALEQEDSASSDPGAIPTGGILVPTLGVGGHCLPKDGILLWWRALEAGVASDRSLILEARRINDESPGYTLSLARGLLPDLAGRRVALLGAAYRPDSEDTRNSPTFALARLLSDAGCSIRIQDPHVRDEDPNLVRLGLQPLFTRDRNTAMAGAELVFLCVAHAAYREAASSLLDGAVPGAAIVDACNLHPVLDPGAKNGRYAGIGRGRVRPPAALVEGVVDAFRTMELGVAAEVRALVEFLNRRYARDDFDRASYEEVRRLAATCATGCALRSLDGAGPPDETAQLDSRLARRARAWFPDSPPAARHAS